MLVLRLAKRRGYPAETLTLLPAKCHCESPATERDNNGEREIGIVYEEINQLTKFNASGFESRKTNREIIE